MIRFFCKLKRNKILMALFIVFLVIMIFDLALLIFDIIQLCDVAVNSASLSKTFFGFNIFMFALNILGLLCVFAYLIFNKFKLIKINKK